MLTDEFKDLIGDVISKTIENGLEDNSISAERAKEIAAAVLNLTKDYKNSNQNEIIENIKEQVPEAKQALDKIKNA